MKYIKLDENKWIEVNEEKNTATVFFKSEIEIELADAEARLLEIPNEPSDLELLTWARENYPKVDYSVEKQSLEEIVSKNQNRLDEILN